MSADNAAAATAPGYVLRVIHDGARHYDCNSCGHTALDLDSARTHHALHVAGPDLYAALEGLANCPDVNLDDLDELTTAAVLKARAVLDKARPKG